MAKQKVIKKKRYRLNVKALFYMLLILLIIILVCFKIINLRLKNIYITGTDYLTDDEVIKVAKLEDYPRILQIHPGKITKNLKKLDLVNDVKVRVNPLGSIKIKIDEAKILFIDTDNLVVLSNGKKIKNDNYLGIPILVNTIPKNIYQEFVKSLIKIDDDILHLVSEIEYYPSTSNNVVIDDKRFSLTMNDGNTVYINTVNIKQLNKYLEIYKAIANNQKGVLYLDSYNSDNYYFTPYSSIRANQPQEEQNEN